MTTNTISASDKSLVQVRLVEVRDTGRIDVNDRHFAIKAGSSINVTPSLCEGANIIKFVVNTDSIKNDPSRLLSGNHEWVGRFEIYVDGTLAGSYSKRGTYIIGGKENAIASVEVNIVKDTSKPTVMQLINQLQQVKGITDADKADFQKSHPHIMFKNGVTVHTWKNHAGVDHVFVTDRTEECVYGGYVGWIHSKDLQNILQNLHNDLGAHIA
jgi:hypothetical protein